MSILIKDMEMPKSCYRCPMANDDFYLCGATEKYLENDSEERRPDWCPLVEIPTPHGRLIDADAVNKAMDERIEKLKDDKSIYEASCVATALDMFAPTVIEAEGSEE